MNINEVSKFYKNTNALDNISFDFEKGEIIGLVGRNGAGKSTLMKIITKNILSFNGSITINSSVGYLIEDPKLIANMSGLEHLVYFSTIYGNKFDINDFKDLLVSLDLYQILNQKVKEYSLGMKQKLAVVISILNSPDYVVLDEPTNGMDVESSYEILNVLKKLAMETNLGILISSHKLEDIEVICDRILFLENGILIGEEKISQSSQNLIQIIFSNNDDLNMFINKQELGNVFNVTQDTLTLQTNLNSSEVFRLLNELNIFIIDCHTEKNTLRNIYLDKFGGEKNEI
ncbi:ABC transporter ATP-binding protein [Candidatus Enterococcus lemimoniae]|uniref:ABC-2 type transport system ATP-binding protein n=1 Tax=Candidatus Enterococcus lemimoniae TaxID=1834167 RepID=A0ABZ2T2A7_9ENTE